MKKILLLFLCVVSSQLLTAKTVGPLIQTQWNQTPPYNQMIPEKDGQHCVASCGAAAMAQICYYHRWPEHGMGEGSWSLGDESHRVDLTPDYYDYDKMLLTYDDNSSQEAIDAVALLIRDVAFLGASFGLYDSYSPSPQGLAEAFGYDRSIKHLDRSRCSLDDFVGIIRSELDAGRPVLLDGSNGLEGHMFICDGYNDENDTFHFNYGWGGLHDGWSSLEDCLFPVSMAINYDIKKDEGGTPGFTLGCSRDFKWLEGNKLYCNVLFNCLAPWYMQLQMALAVENTQTHEVQYFCHYDREWGSDELMEFTWELDAELADGSYTLYPVGRDMKNNGPWQRCYFRDLCQTEVSLTVQDGVKTFANENLSQVVRDGVIEIAGLCYELDETVGTATLTYRNDKFDSYSGDIVVPESITAGDKTYRVTAIGERAFLDCKSLGNVVIGKNVVEIGWGAFSNAIANKVTFAEGSQLKHVGDFAFYVVHMQEVVLPEGLERLGSSAFGNAHVGCLTIPSTITRWDSACLQTIELKSVRVNSATPFAIDRCFRYFREGQDFCDHFEKDWDPYAVSVTTLYVPAGAKAAYEQADVWKEFGFILEPGDDDSYMDALIHDCVELDGIAYQINGTKGIASARMVKNTALKDIVLKNTITLGGKTLTVAHIGNQCFNFDTYNSIVIPASVEVLGSQALNVCTVGTLTFEEGSQLKTIEDDAMNGLTIMSPVVLPEGLETFGHASLKLADLTIPATVTTIGGDFCFDGSMLRHVRVSWPTPPVVPNLFDESQFMYGNSLDRAILHVPVGTRELYAQAEGWKLFPNIVEGNEDTAIGAISAGCQPSVVYTLDGRRVRVSSASQLPRGIYVIGGQKVVK